MGEKVLPDVYFANVLKIFDMFKRNDININQLEIKNPDLYEIESTDSHYPKFIFDLREDPSFADRGISKIKDTLSKLEYVDLRVKNRIYYK